ncbi:hypothetical protein [uncultured Draconibacterium sp.]|uniref:hypothetical protein n=1 Tax=uncultured Draconibacterium sp. TaxID=1573823 RepID=UPI0025DD41DF|nr:hypothetical protein [uncultured Draconibacterium sp.]
MKEIEFEHIERQDYSEEMNQIVSLSGIDKRDLSIKIWLEELKVNASANILNSYGREFKVKRGKIDRRTHKLGQCYWNSNKMMDEGYQYVEGVIIPKDGSSQFSHAWNVDGNGNHYDFTIDDPEKYTYIGIVLNEMNVMMVGYNNGCIHYCTLPFLKLKR